MEFGIENEYERSPIKLPSFDDAGDHVICGNETAGIIIGASPSYYASWHWFSKLLAVTFISCVILINLIVITIYFRLRHKATMHEIHVCHLAFCDLLAGLLAFAPIATGHIKVWYGDISPFFYVPCFAAAMGTHACNLMATFICIFISYDRLRLLQLGVRYRMTSNRLAGHLRLGITWTLMVILTAIATALIISTQIGKQLDDCAYTFATKGAFVQILMTVVALGPLLTLLVLNLLVRRFVRQLEEQRPTSTTGRGSKASPSSPGSVPALTQQEMASYPAEGNAGARSKFSNVAFVTPSIATPERRSGSQAPSSILGSGIRQAKYRQLSSRATATVFLSTTVFIVCLGPLIILLLIEAWSPGTIRRSTHRWHMWFTLFRTLVDPFLFARNVPSFRFYYGTVWIFWSGRWPAVKYFRHVVCRPCCLCNDLAIVENAQEKLDRKRGSRTVNGRKSRSNTNHTNEGPSENTISHFRNTGSSHHGLESITSEPQLKLGPKQTDKRSSSTSV